MTLTPAEQAKLLYEDFAECSQLDRFRRLLEWIASDPAGVIKQNPSSKSLRLVTENLRAALTKARDRFVAAGADPAELDALLARAFPPNLTLTRPVPRGTLTRSLMP